MEWIGKKPAYNWRARCSCATSTSGLAKLGGKVIARTSARPLTVSGNPNGVQSGPNFAKLPPPLAAICGRHSIDIGENYKLQGYEM